MNSRDSNIRTTEMVAAPLESFGGQRVSNETYAAARAARKWIADNPGKRSIEMPEHVRQHLGFLCQKRLITWHGQERRFEVVRLK